ncbi:MAG: TetR/AcrR family transcriptional regulator [Pseudomonadota bacterium]
MSRKSDQRAQATKALASHILENGLAQTSLRQLAAAAGVSDRMLLYYFEDKTEALTAALGAIAAEMTAALATVIPEGEKLSAGELFEKLSALTMSAKFKPYMRISMEMIAASNDESAPYGAISNSIATGFLHWIAGNLVSDAGSDTNGDAAAILALLDGLIVLSICAGDDTALLARNRLVETAFRAKN